MVEIVELSSSEERSNTTVPPENVKVDEPKSSTNLTSTQTGLDKSTTSDSNKTSSDKSAKGNQSNKSGKNKSKKGSQSSKDKSPKKASQTTKDKSTTSESTNGPTKDESKLNSNHSADKDDANHSSNSTDDHGTESAKNNGAENKEESKSSEVVEDESPKKKLDEPVRDNSPVSSDDEDSQDGFTVTANSLYRENDQGKEMFVKGDYDSAIQMWSKSIESLSMILDKARNNPNHDITEIALHEFTKMYVIFCSNLALAHIKKGNYEKSKEYCQYVLMYDEKSLKAHLRIVQADIKLNNFEQALKNCNKGLEFHPDNHELISLRNKINEELRSYHEVEKLFCRNAFKKIEVDPRTKEDRKPGPLGSSLQSLNYKFLMLYYKVFLVFKKGFLSFAQVFLSTKNTLKHTYTRFTRPFTGLFKRSKLS